MTASTTWQPIMGDGTEVTGYWRVHAATEEAAKSMVEARMIMRAYFSLCREWRNGGKKVREVQDANE
mgnify:CR=1 FL=1